MISYVTMAPLDWQRRHKVACFHCGLHKPKSEMFHVYLDGQWVAQVCTTCQKERENAE